MGYALGMKPRHLLPVVRRDMSRFPAVFLGGPRQSGKSTLVRQLAREAGDARVITFDDVNDRTFARRNPQEFIESLQGTVILDEVQRVPEIFLPLKLSIDTDRRPGRFLLTGSAHYLMLPKVTESLAGRVALETLWPFSQGEIDGTPDGFLTALFDDPQPDFSHPGQARTAIIRRIVQGSFPEVSLVESPEHRLQWYRSYVTTLIQQEVDAVSRIESVSDMARLLDLLSSRVGTLFNASEFSRTTGISASTLKRYVGLLEMTYAIQRIRPWAGAVTRQLTRTPKLLMPDTGLAAALSGRDEEGLERRPADLGPLLENFVGSELMKQASFSAPDVRLMHFRSHGGDEVDFVLQKGGGKVVGVEVKSATVLSPSDWQGLTRLKARLGAQFHRGVVLYCGREARRLEPDLWAYPVNALWEMSPPAGG